MSVLPSVGTFWTLSLDGSRVEIVERHPEPFVFAERFLRKILSSGVVIEFSDEFYADGEPIRFPLSSDDCITLLGAPSIRTS